MGVARAASQGQVGARPRGRRGHVNREEGGSGVRFASDSLQVTAKPAGAGAERPRSGGLHLQRSPGGSVDPGFRRESARAAVSSRMGLCCTGPIANQPGTASATASSWLLFFSEELHKKLAFPRPGPVVLAVIFGGYQRKQRRDQNMPSPKMPSTGSRPASTRLPIRSRRTARPAPRLRARSRSSGPCRHNP